MKAEISQERPKALPVTQNASQKSSVAKIRKLGTKFYFGQLIVRKIIKFVATRSHILRQNAPNSISAGAPPQTPLGELTALP